MPPAQGIVKAQRRRGSLTAPAARMAIYLVSTFGRARRPRTWLTMDILFGFKLGQVWAQRLLAKR